jgi:trk system potassium uptake protein TrkA
MELYAVIGLGRFGLRLAEHMASKGAEVIAIDADRDLVEKLRDKVTMAVCLNATDEDALRSQGIEKVDVAVVGIGQGFEANALATSVLKTLGVKKVFSRAGSEMQARILKRIGADGVIFPESESADNWGHRLLLPHLMHKIELGVGHSLIEMKTPRSFVGKNLIDLHLRKKYQVNLVAIKRQVSGETDSGESTMRQELISVPSPDQPLQEDDILIFVGEDENLARLPRE